MGNAFKMHSAFKFAGAECVLASIAYILNFKICPSQRSPVMNGGISTF